LASASVVIAELATFAFPVPAVSDVATMGAQFIFLGALPLPEAAPLSEFSTASLSLKLSSFPPSISSVLATVLVVVDVSPADIPVGLRANLVLSFF